MASIKCGSCKETHGTITEVRECYSPQDRYVDSYDAELMVERIIEDRGYWSE